jgi:hypothetical protein
MKYRSVINGMSLRERKTVTGQKFGLWLRLNQGTLTEGVELSTVDLLIKIVCFVKEEEINQF